VLLASFLVAAGCSAAPEPTPIDPARSLAGASAPPSSSSSRSSSSAPCARVVIAEVPMWLDAMAAEDGVIYAASAPAKSVVAIRVDGGAPTIETIASAENQPFAIVLRRGSPIWASGDGVFGWTRRTGRVAIVQDDVRAIASGPAGVYFARGSTSSFWRVDWPSSTQPVEVVKDADVGVSADLVATSTMLAWSSSGSVWSFRLADGARTEIEKAMRRPHDLSVGDDGRTLLWHESEASLLPGSAPRAFTADLGAPVPTAQPFATELESSSAYRFRGRCLVAPGSFLRDGEAKWHRFDRGEGTTPMTDDGRRWYWVEPAGTSTRIVAADLARCCR
jgi:hypothetical protein